jgi:chemotaxis protein methyltransferase CheR
MSLENNLHSAEPENFLNDDEFTKLRTIVHQNTGITIAENRRSMLYSRLQRRLRETGEANFGGYISRVSSDPEEMQELTNRITTNETYFYRTPRIWSHLRNKTIPEFLATGKSDKMRVWSAAASTGEEAYTLGTVLEDVRNNNPGFEYSVLGTDISSRVITVAKEGCYVGRSVARFRKEDPTLFGKYMFGNDTDGYRVTEKIKPRITFKLHNLIKPLKSVGPFEVVFLRNVLIYFSAEDQCRILDNIHANMSPTGTLIIGESESLKGLDSNFEPIAPLIYRPAQRGSKAKS